LPLTGQLEQMRKNPHAESAFIYRGADSSAWRFYGAHLFDMTSDVLLIIARFFLAVKTVSSICEKTATECNGNTPRHE
jgi:hypothetical protein